MTVFWSDPRFRFTTAPDIIALHVIKVIYLDAPSQSVIDTLLCEIPI